MKLNGNSHGEHTGERDEKVLVTEVRSDETAEDTAPADGQKKKSRRGFVIGGCVLLALLAVVVGYAIWEKPPEINVDPPEASNAPAATARPTADPGVTQDVADTIPPEEDDADAPAIAMSSDRKAGFYTFLLAGIDKASSSTDTVMAVSFDTKGHAISCTSIPRDSLINIGWTTTQKKLNAVYPAARNSGGDPAEALKAQLKNLLGFAPDCYVFVDIAAVEHIVDAIGGVEFDVPQDMDYWDPEQNLRIDIKAGLQTLSGEDAVKVCRFRATYSGGDLQRIGVQQAFLKAMASQVISKGIPHLSELIDIVMEDVDTDLKAENIAWLVRQFLACKSEDIVFQTMPITNNGNNVNGVSLVGADVDAWLAMINANINPYQDDVTVGNVNILTYGWNGNFVGATTGKIEGGPDSFYCPSCSNALGERVGHAPGAHIAVQETAAPAEGGTGSGPEIVTITPGEGS